MNAGTPSGPDSSITKAPPRCSAHAAACQEARRRAEDRLGQGRWARPPRAGGSGRLHRPPAAAGGLIVVTTTERRELAEVDALAFESRNMIPVDLSPRALRDLGSALLERARAAEAVERRAYRELTDEGVDRLAEILAAGSKPTLGFWRRNRRPA